MGQQGKGARQWQQQQRQQQQEEGGKTLADHQWLQHGSWQGPLRGNDIGHIRRHGTGCSSSKSSRRGSTTITRAYSSGRSSQQLDVMLGLGPGLAEFAPGSAAHQTVGTSAGADAAGGLQGLSPNRLVRPGCSARSSSWQNAECGSAGVRRTSCSPRLYNSPRWGIRLEQEVLGEAGSFQVAYSLGWRKGAGGGARSAGEGPPGAPTTDGRGSSKCGQRLQ